MEIFGSYMFEFSVGKHMEKEVSVVTGEFQHIF